MNPLCPFHVLLLFVRCRLAKKLDLY
uniref:Uncharacterized protein n=1 Tax=Anguilla anguilla TaxID=7936 RepID=A0A0E9PNB8_ANGAN